DVTSSGSAPSNSTQVDFNWSKNGNRTRLDVSVGNQKYAIEYGSEEEFLTKMRGVTVFVVNKLNYPGRKNIKILGLDGYDLSTAFTPAPVSANFTKFNNVITRFGAPMGGFYIANSLVTQREYEAVMGQNPSVVKNPSQPVTNVNFRDAMIFCSQLSIRDGLDPFYIVNEFGPGDLHRDILHTVGRTNDNFSTGYRLAFLDEWEYAKDQITGMGTLPEYVNNIKSVFVGNTVTDNAQYIIKDNEPQTIGQTQGRDGNILPVIRLVRPIMDYWKFISGGVWDTNVKFFVIRN
ncbi:MAG: formylglycine-generating enzyme family protein, partial [Treponema sp.]|nr:formylglycine-generating enzyme family protein [Treponema sp.]